MAFPIAFDEHGFQVVPPNGDKQYSIQFGSKCPFVTRLTNNVVRDVMQAAGLRPFHQGGSSCQTGWQMWEVWARTDMAQMTRIAQVSLYLVHRLAAMGDCEGTVIDDTVYVTTGKEGFCFREVASITSLLEMDEDAWMGILEEHNLLDTVTA